MPISDGGDFAMRGCGIRCRGFTLVELVGSLIIASILTLVALPRLFDQQAFDARIFHDRAQSMLRYAKKIAIAQNRNVYVRLDGTSFAFCFSDFVANPDGTLSREHQETKVRD